MELRDKIVNDMWIRCSGLCGYYRICIFLLILVYESTIYALLLFFLLFIVACIFSTYIKFDFHNLFDIFFLRILSKMEGLDGGSNEDY